MGLFDKIRGEFIDVIEWTDSSPNTLVYRFPRHNNEIKNGAELTVREGQAAVFIDEGQLADVFSPGMYQLETENLPILSTFLIRRQRSVFSQLRRATSERPIRIFSSTKAPASTSSALATSSI